MNAITFSPKRLSAGLLVLFSATSVFAQGSLTPPGPPAPTMKTLDQLDTKLTTIDSKAEKRIPIDAANTPGDATHLFIISQPGSYYLTANITGVSGKDGIYIAATGVTIDLNGFALLGVAGSKSGIAASGFNGNEATVRNGTVTGWDAGGVSLGQSSIAQHIAAVANGPSSGTGLSITSGTIDACVANGNWRGITVGPGSVIKASAAENNMTYGIVCSANCAISDTTASGNSSGFAAGDGTAMTNCAADNNKGYGIYAGDGATVTHCAATFNITDDAVSGIGIRVGSSSSIVDCTASANSGDGIQFIDGCVISRATASKNGSGTGAGGIGIHGTGARSRITESDTSNNRAEGVVVNTECSVAYSHASGNGSVGIRATGNDNSIASNHVTTNSKGISVAGTGNLIDANCVRDNTGPGIEVTTTSGKNIVIRNVAGNNVNSYAQIASGNNVAPIDTNFSSTNPFANFQN